LGGEGDGTRKPCYLKPRKKRPRGCNFKNGPYGRVEGKLDCGGGVHKGRRTRQDQKKTKEGRGKMEGVERRMDGVQKQHTQGKMRIVGLLAGRTEAGRGGGDEQGGCCKKFTRTRGGAQRVKDGVKTKKGVGCNEKWGTYWVGEKKKTG